MSEQTNNENKPTWEALTITPLYFQAVGAGTGRTIPTGSRVTIRSTSISDDVATFVDGERVFESFIERVNYRPIEDFDALKARAGSD